MTLALICLVFRRHPFSCIATAAAVIASAALLQLPLQLLLVAWGASAVVVFEVWYAVEPFVFRRFGFRTPSCLESDRLKAALGCQPLELLVADSDHPRLARGVRTLAVSRVLLDILEDPGLAGLLAPSAAPALRANLAAELIVWLGNLPLLTAWWLTRLLGQVGRLLAVILGEALNVPLILWPHGFIRWAGRLFGALIAGLLGSALLSSGLAGPGLGLLVAWLLVPALRALVDWEHRRNQWAADQEAVANGLGAGLLEALDLLAVAEPLGEPEGLFGIACRADPTFISRADRVRRRISTPCS